MNVFGFGTDDYTELGVPGGHIGTFGGGKAQKILAPSIVRWLTRTPPAGKAATRETTTRRRRQDG